MKNRSERKCSQQYQVLLVVTPDHSVVEAGFDSTIRSTIWTGRPLRAAATSYIRDWEVNRRNELEGLLAKGIIPIDYEMNTFRGAGGVPKEVAQQSEMRYVVLILSACVLLVTSNDRPMRIACGLINNGQQSAADIVEEMVAEAAERLSSASSVLVD